MHIYDLLGNNLHSLRAGRDVFQLCLREDKANPKNIPESLECSVKKDGLFIFAGLHRETNYSRGTPILFARSGQQITNQALLNLPQNITELLQLNSNVLFQFELKSTDLRNTVFNGAISPVRKNPLEADTARRLRSNEMWLTDAVHVHDFIGLGHMPKKPRCERRLDMNRFACEFDLLMPEWRMLPYAGMMAWAENLIDNGEEGVCGYNPDGLYEPGNRRADLVIKKAKEISLDLRCVAVRPGKKGKRLGMAEGFDMQYGDKVIKADLGEGWTDEMRIHILKNPSEAVGHIYRVYAFDKSELGQLRQPKVGERRDDKTIPDEVE